MSRGLPKTMAAENYADYDDAWFHAGWWIGKGITDNKTRFIQRTINGDVVVMDRATGLMWVQDGDAAGANNGNKLIWDAAVAYPPTLTFAGFSDWRLPNINELASLAHYGRYNPAGFPTVFANMKNSFYWSSTTFNRFITSAWFFYYGDGDVRNQAKTEESYILSVRGGV